jgi:outer membrane protein OmpA-like peptidoglycan-associated protein
MNRLCRTPHVLLIAVASVIAALGFAPSALAVPGPGPSGLGSASSFGVLGSTNVVNTGPTVVNGELGIAPGTSVAGFPPGVVNGNLHFDDPLAAQAHTDSITAFGEANTPSATLIPGNLAAQTLGPGVYHSAGNMTSTGTLTLDAGGNPNAMFIIRAGGTLTTSAASQVVLIDGAQASNVYWVVDSATLGTTSTFAGTLFASFAVSANSGVLVRGRLLSRNATVTLDFDTVDVPVGTTTTLTSSANPSGLSAPVSYAAAVTPDFGTQTVGDGSVAFSDENGPIAGCAAVSVAAGDAICDTTSAPTAGSHTITATYTPAALDITFDASASQPFTQTVAPTPPPPVTTTTTTATTTTGPVTTTPPTTTLPTTAGPTAGSPSPTATATAAATSKSGVVKLDAGQSSAATGTTITGYRWYLGTKLIGRTESLDYRIPAGVRKATFTLRVTDSAGETATSDLVILVHGHDAPGALSATTLFTPNSARLTPGARGLLTKLRPVLLGSSQVTIDGYTAGLPGPQTVQRHKRSALLSANRAKAVEAFLFHGHAPSGVHLSVSGMGRAEDSAGLVRNRKTTVSYTRFVVTSIT